MTPTHATLDANKQLAVRWLDLVSSGDVEAICALTTRDWTMTGGPPDLPTGHAGVRAHFATSGEITQTWHVDDVIAEADRVAVRATNHCVQDSFLGIPAAGVEQVFTATFIFQIAPTAWSAGSGATPPKPGTLQVGMGRTCPRRACHHGITVGASSVPRGPGGRAPVPGRRRPSRGDRPS